jgi:hypothetical protein
MDDDTKNKLKDVLSSIDPAEFKWNNNNMSTQTGLIAHEVDSTTIDLSGSYDTITIDPIDLGSINMSSITITGATDNSGAYLTSGSNGASWTSFSTSPSISIGNEHGKNVIKTNKHEIDLDELGDMMETLKKRLLILTPNFEQMEKYPMLKEMYDEYKAMERLLSGPEKEDE